MSLNTSVSLDNHLNQFINEKIEIGRFESPSGAVMAGLRLLEERENKLELIR